MKTIRCRKSAIGFSAIVALAVASFTFAGPGPQFWAQKESDRAANAKKTPTTAATADTAKPAPTPSMVCPNCKTRVHEETSPAVAGRFPPHYTAIGLRHYCNTCGGYITTVRGKTTNDMKGNCPICAKSSPTCCGATGQTAPAS